MPEPVYPVVGQVVFDTLDARRAAEFWRELLGIGYRPGHEPPRDGADDVRGRDWLNLVSASGDRWLAFQQVGELTTPTWPSPGVPQQLHLDLTVASAVELDSVLEHATSLGARLLLDRRGDAGEPLVVLADPDGHPFCVFVAG